jgi:hypothetical protein
MVLTPLQLARHQVRLAQIATPRMQDALTELEDILQDQIETRACEGKGCRQGVCEPGLSGGQAQASL